MRVTKRRIVLVGLLAGFALASSAGMALAVLPNHSVARLTGCLNTSASPGRRFVNVKQGESPAKPCGSGQAIAHLSDGDITDVHPASGSGSSGGTDNGANALDSTDCSSGGFLKWDGSAWVCGMKPAAVRWLVNCVESGRHDARARDRKARRTVPPRGIPRGCVTRKHT